MFRKLVSAAFLFLAPSLSVHSQGSSDIASSDSLIAFAQAIARPTALAETEDSSSVKFILVVMKDGKPVVGRIALLANDEHAASAEFASGLSPVLMIHVHHSGMAQEPQSGDWYTVRAYGIPNIVVSSDGEKLWEAGVVAGKDVFRDISTSVSGPWRPMKSGT
jgi:Cu/Zn superoxide dismutase